MPSDGRGKWKLIRRQGQQNLPRAAQLAEPREDETDRLLEPQVRIEAEAHLAMPDVTDRHADPQFAAPRLGSRRVVHSGAQHAEFELADAALHSQQEPVVRAARVINPVEIDDARADKTAEFQQVMPVAAVAGKPRSVEAQHGADVAGAKPRDKPIEARPRHRPARRAPKIVVDDLDVAEAAAARLVDQVVLTPLAFEVGLNLGLRRLPDVHDGFPLQDRRGKKVSAASSPSSSAGATPAACIRRLARRATTLWRSCDCIIQSCGASNASASWRGPSAFGFAVTGFCRRFIGLLLGNSDFAGRASPKTAIDEEPGEVLERRDIDMRIAERQVGAGRRVKHPAWHDDHHARARFDVAHRVPVPYLAVMLADAPAVQSVPAIMNLDLMPDTGPPCQ